MTTMPTPYESPWDYQSAQYQMPTVGIEVKPVFLLSRWGGEVFNPEEDGLNAYITQLVAKAAPTVIPNVVKLTSISGFFPGDSELVVVPEGQFAVLVSLAVNAPLKAEDYKPAVRALHVALASFFDDYSVKVTLAKVTYARHVTTTETGILLV